MPPRMLTQAANPVATSSWASSVASKSRGTVVRARTKSLIGPYFPCTRAKNLIKHETRMNDTVKSDDAGPPSARPRVRRRLSAQEVRERRRRVVTWALSILLGVLLVNAFVGESGYLANLQAARDQAILEDTVARLRLENQALQLQGRRLQFDP